MKFKILILFTTVCASHLQQALCLEGSTAQHENASSSESDLQTLVSKFINKVGEILHGNDPYSYGGSSSNSSTYGVHFNGSLNDLIISGISTMNVTYLDVTQVDSNINLRLDMVFSNIVVTGNYFLDLDMLTLLKLYGSGELGTKASFLGINITASVAQDLTNRNVLQFTDLIIDLEVPKLKIDAKNLLNRPAVGTFASKILTDISPKLLSKDGRVLSMLSSWAKSKLNEQALQHEITLAFVIEFMQKFIG